MGPVIFFGLILGIVGLVVVILWQAYKTLLRFGHSVWHFFVENKTTQ